MTAPHAQSDAHSYPYTFPSTGSSGHTLATRSYRHAFPSAHSSRRSVSPAFPSPASFPFPRPFPASAFSSPSHSLRPTVEDLR